MTQRSPFRCFRTSPEIIRLAVMMYVGIVRGTWPGKVQTRSVRSPSPILAMHQETLILCPDDSGAGR